MALHLDGTYAWHFQQVHHDLWDFDCPSAVVLFDQMYGGKLRKGIAEACKTGWIYILDRTNGKPLIGIEEKPVEQDARVCHGGDAAVSGRRCGDPAMPAATRGLDHQMHFRRHLRRAGPDVARRQWRRELGADGLRARRPVTSTSTAADRPASRIAPGHRQDRAAGHRREIFGGTLTAVDSRTNRIVWQKKTPYSIGQGSGALITASGLLFHGEPDGNFQAYDANSGELLWQWQTGAGADAPAITYEIDGEQYVAIAAGGLSIQTASANGDMIWAFSLKGNASSPHRAIRGASSAAIGGQLQLHRTAQGRGADRQDQCGQDDRLRLQSLAHNGHDRHEGDFHQYRRSSRTAPPARTRVAGIPGS